MRPLTASVPPLLERSVSKEARDASRQRFTVRPSRAISGIGQLGNESRICSAILRPSIGSVADAYDNALMECVIGLYKTECIRTTVFHAGPYRTIGDVEYATAGWVDWYNNRRLHGTLGMMTPVEFEQAHYATLNREPQPV